MNKLYQLILILLCSLISFNSFADANYSLRDSSHPWFPLTRAKWKMESIQYPNQPKQNTLKNGFDVKKVTMSIRRGSIGFGLGCNGHGGKLKLLGNNKLQSERLIQTMMGCKKQLESADNEISKLLAEVSHFNTNQSNTQPTLALQSKNGTRLYFRGEPIPKVKYGKAKIRRIELKHRKKDDCAKQGCKEWREVFTNQKGAITHKSAWAYNPLEIQNFKSSPNYWYGLRVKEFNTQNGIVWYLESNGSSANLDYAEGRFKHD